MAVKKSIVIVGGGSAGSLTAKALSDALDPENFTIQLVNARNFAIHFPAMLRTLTTSEGHLEKQIFIPYDKLFSPGKAGELVVGVVKQVADGVVTLEGGRTLPYDWLVLASGTKWEGPLDIPYTVEEAEGWIDSWRSKIAGAQNIVLGGAGAVGIELAGEIKAAYPEKDVIIVHAGDNVLNDTYPDKVRNAGLAAIKKFGIKVMLDDKVEIPSEPYTSVTTAKGSTINADLIIPTRGGRPNTDFIRSLDPSIFTEKGTIKVLPTLQVPLANGKTNVYAAGDIIEWNEQKQLAKAPSHAGVVSANILEALHARPATKKYGGFMEAIILPLGPTGGFGYIPLLWGIVLGDFMSRTIKSKSLLVSMGRKSFGY